MKNKILAIIAIISICFATYLFYYYKKSVRQIETVIEAPTLNTIARESVGRPVTTSTTITTTNHCVEFTNFLETNPFSVFVNEMRTGTRKIPAGCEQVLGNHFLTIQRACVDPQNPDCESTLFMFRASRLADFYRDVPLNQQSTEALSQRVFFLLGSANLNSIESAKNLRALAHELMIRDPRSASATKLEVFSYIIEKNLMMNDPTIEWPMEKEQEYQRALERAYELNPNDPDIYENYMFNEISNRGPEIAYQAAQANPTSSSANFVAGCAALRAGNPNLATQYFQAGYQSNPQNRKLNEIAQGTSIEQNCSPQLNFDASTL